VKLKGINDLSIFQINIVRDHFYILFEI